MSSHRVNPSIQVQLRRIAEALRWRYSDDQPPCYGHGYGPWPLALIGETGPELIDATHITSHHMHKEQQ